MLSHRSLRVMLHTRTMLMTEVTIDDDNDDWFIHNV